MPRRAAIKDELFRSAIGFRMIVDRRFQFKYTALFVGAVLIALLPISFITLYFLNQNYTIFLDLALTYSPNLLPHLQRERVWINGLIVTTILSITIFFVFYGLRFTGRLILPLLILKEQIRRLSRGQWDTPEVRLRESDEFQDLVETTQYFYKFLRFQTKQELEALKKIELDPNGSESKQLLQQLIEEKSKRLNETPNATQST